MFDLAFEGLDVGDEGDSVRGAGRIHRVLLQFHARLQKQCDNKQYRLTFKINKITISNDMVSNAIKMLKRGDGEKDCTLDIWEWKSCMF